MAENKDKSAGKEAKAAAKAAAKAKKERIKQNKPKKDPNAPNIFKRVWAVILRFVKDFRGTVKKVNWPDRKTVMKNFVVVLAVVVVIGSAIWIIDAVLSNSIGFVMGVADDVRENRVTEPATDEHGHDDLEGLDDYGDYGQAEETTEADGATEGVTESAAEAETEAASE